MDQFSTYWPILSICFVIATSVWSIALWLNGHFNTIRKEITALGKEIVDKLQYHERHDDQRFGQIQEALTDIRVRNAAMEALNVLREKNREENK
jgi:hypothetical protein